jgi:hypothetical protein
MATVKIERLSAGAPDTPLPLGGRKQHEAYTVAKQEYSFRCCVICGLQLVAALELAHLDHQPGNNDPDNLAWLCGTHHWMFDCDLYPIEAVKLMRKRWQETQGKASHAGRMKQAGPKAAATRKRSASARRAWTTRRARSEEDQTPM